MALAALSAALHAAEALPPSQQAASLLAAGDSAGALEVLEHSLDRDSMDTAEPYLRGRLLLAAGRLDEAERDFRKVIHSGSDSLRALAHLGLGDIRRTLPYRRGEAVGEYRRAIQADSLCFEAYYRIAETAFELGWTSGYQSADDILARLVRLNPNYRDALDIWWKRIFSQSDKRLREVGASLERYLATHPGDCRVCLYAARIRQRLWEAGTALALLDSLALRCPEYRCTESWLIRAHCRLSLGDTLGFESAYAQALHWAAKEDDFEQLFREAELIFSPVEARRWNSLTTPAEKEAFFHAFWTRRDPDPLEPHNERLVTHYCRLQYAKRNYFEYNPHSFYNTSEKYNRLISTTDHAGMDMSESTRPQEPEDSNDPKHPYFDPKYDPSMWWDRCRTMALQPRGLFYVRHGEPDFLYKFGLPWNAEFDAPDYEAWRYGSAYFLFNRVISETGGAGKYIYKNFRGRGDITRAMQTDSFRDPLPAFRPDLFAVDFKAGPGRLELLFFQSAPQDSVVTANAPFSDLALFDSTWTRLVARDSSIAWPLTVGAGRLWLAANRATVAPGRYNFVHRLDVPSRRAVLKRQSVSLPSYPEDRFCLSGILLGTHPERGQGLFNRYGVEINPRPGLRFSPGEAIAVYLEAYGLGEGRKGGRAFRERVTVSRDEKRSPLVKLLPFAFRDRKKSLSMTFERFPEDAPVAVPETFDLDTTPLMPGVYALTVEITDRGSGTRCSRGCSFEISER
ncbi:GWxTD domain-containing protein [bacterium]|nr:GWxTD domain-containing protein [bacterium]